MGYRNEYWLYNKYVQTIKNELNKDLNRGHQVSQLATTKIIWNEFLLKNGKDEGYSGWNIWEIRYGKHYIRNS